MCREKALVPRTGLIAFEQHQEMGISDYKTPGIRPGTNSPAKIPSTFEGYQLAVHNLRPVELPFSYRSFPL